jgi:hypothetical protein
MYNIIRPCTQHCVVFSEKKPAVFEHKNRTIVPQNRISYLISIFRTARIIGGILCCARMKIYYVFSCDPRCIGSHAEKRLFGSDGDALFFAKTRNTHTHTHTHILTKAVVDQLLRETQFLCRSYGPRVYPSRVAETI